MNINKSIIKFIIATQIFLPLMSSSISVASTIQLNNNGIKYDRKLTKIQRNLPDLSNLQSNFNTQSNDEFVATGLVKSAQIINSDNSNDEAKKLIKSSVYGYVNQSMNDWLNQYGNGRIQINTDKTFSGELLLPIYDFGNNFIFSQSRIQRQNEDRTILNLGLGYRYFSTNKMWGVNNFYDRDLKNNNARWGLGAEFGVDYFKMAANGYFRLTNWKQSRLSNFNDYDERPANGFDLRIEGFLPNYPFIGANLKYEKYFGDKVNLKGTNSINDLKNNPQAYTAGVSYTPVPLVSFKLSQIMGDVNETKGELSLEYRFGVPLREQLDSKFVPQMRTLQSAKYDFIDRNNTIVMQYKKQELINISLPSKPFIGQYKDSVFIPLTINKSKYAIKNANWNTSSLTKTNAIITEKSLKGITITLPKYESNSANVYPISVEVIDEKGNKSNKATATIQIEKINGMIQLSIEDEKFNAVADDQDYITATATVTEDGTKPLVNSEVKFSLPSKSVTLIAPSTDGEIKSSGEITVFTDNSGKATIKIRNTIAEELQLEAKLESSDETANETISFTSNEKTASVVSVDLVDSEKCKHANGKDYFEFKTKVEDAYGNPVNNVEVTWKDDSNGKANLEKLTSKTDEKGIAIIKLYSTNKAVSNIQVSASVNSVPYNYKSANDKVTFTGDEKTANVTSVVLVESENKRKFANGEDYFEFKAIVEDENGNSVNNIEVTWKDNSNGKAKLENLTSKTNEYGFATIRLYSTKEAVNNLTVTAERKNSNIQSTSSENNVRFVTVSFEIYPTDNYYISGINIEYLIKAKGSDGEEETVTDISTWKSSNQDVAPIQDNGHVTTKKTGQAVISVKDSYHFISFSKEITINVRDEIEYGLYGVANSGQNAKKSYKVTAPDYNIYVRSGGVVDGIGVSEKDYAGGTGGFKFGTVSALGLSKIDIYWGSYGGRIVISSLTFSFNNGKTSQTFGAGTPAVGHTSFSVPKGYVLQGFTAISTPTNDRTYVNQIGFLFVNTNE